MTSENELKDAAYRLRRCEAGETLIAVYDTDTWPLANVAYRDDCERLAIAYIASLAADEQREFERTRLLSLLREVMACGVSYEAKSHVELQVHRTLLADILTALQDAEKGET